MWIGWVLVLYTIHFTLHAFIALASFDSYDLNESLPRRANSQFTSSSHGRSWVVCCCSDWMLKISSFVRHREQQFAVRNWAVRMNGGGKESNFRSLLVIGNISTSCMLILDPSRIGTTDRIRKVNMKIFLPIGKLRWNSGDGIVSTPS